MILLPMTEGEIQYTRSGEYHIAYRVAGEGRGGSRRPLHRGVRLQPRPPAPPSVRVVRETLAALGRLIMLDGRGMGLSDRLHDRRRRSRSGWTTRGPCSTRPLRSARCLSPALTADPLPASGRDLPGEDAGRRADEHRPALRLGAGLSLGNAAARSSSERSRRWSRAGARGRTPSVTPRGRCPG